MKDELPANRLNCVDACRWVPGPGAAFGRMLRRLARMPLAMRLRRHRPRRAQHRLLTMWGGRA